MLRALLPVAGAHLPSLPGDDAEEEGGARLPLGEEEEVPVGLPPDEEDEEDSVWDTPLGAAVLVGLPPDSPRYPDHPGHPDEGGEVSDPRSPSRRRSSIMSDVI